MPTDPSTINHYNQNAENYSGHETDPSENIFHSYYEKPAIRAELPGLEGLDVISIGCGSGTDARWLSDNGAKKVVGIDISKNLIEIAKRNNPDIEFREMDMEKLDFKDESFNLAYSSLALHYIDDWTQPLQEARRILRQDSLYVFSCVHPINSAMERFLERETKYSMLGRKVDKVANKQVFYGDYLAKDDEGVKAVKGMVGDMEVVIYHRTFSKMIKQIRASGFTIERVIEPQPLDNMKEVDPDLHKQLTKMPTFMIWVLKK